MAKRLQTGSTRLSDKPTVTGDNWYTRHRRLILGLVAVLVVSAVAITLLWQKQTIADKFSEEYFKEEAQSDENDSDNDDLNTETENEYGTDPEKRDTDGDGLTDGEEVLTYKTDPLKTDTDGDGYPDQMEVYTGHDPNQIPSTSDSAEDLADRVDNYEAAGLDSVDALLNGEGNSTDIMTLQEMGVGDLSDLSSLYGTGNSSQEITILDSDLIIVPVEEDQAKPLLDQYIDEVTMAALDVFGGDEEAASATVAEFNAGMAGQFQSLRRPAESVAKYTDSLLEIEVPEPAVRLHKTFLELLLQSESMMRGLQRMETGDSMEPMSLLAKMNRIEQLGLEGERELESLSSKYELGLTTDFFSAQASDIVETSDSE